jgi:6-phosphogluconolactonase
MARKSLLDRVPIPPDQVYPMPSEEEPGQAAVHYERTLRAFFQNAPARFDLVLLGLGENGHTASLFPHTEILDERERWVKEVYVSEQDMYRVSLTVPILNQAGQVVFLAHGADKAGVLKDVLLGAPQPRDLPAQLINPANGETIWLLDRDAAAQLPG